MIHAVVSAGLILLFVPQVHAQSAVNFGQRTGTESGTCSPMRLAADFGIAEIDCVDCNTMMSIGPFLRWYSFKSDPVIMSIRRDSPAYGKLASGDRIVSIDGKSIRSAAGAKLLVEPGERARRFSVRRGASVLVVPITPVTACWTSGPVLSRTPQGKSNTLASTAGRLLDLQQSNSETVRAAIEAARTARQQYSQDIITRDSLIRSVNRAVAVDSLNVARATAMYAIRAITRSEFDNEVGVARAEKIIQAAQDTTSASTRQQVIGAMQQLQFQFEVERRQQRDTNLSTFTRAVTDVLNNRINLPPSSLGMGLVCARGCVVENGPAGQRIWTFTEYPVIGAVEPGSTAQRLGLQKGDTLRTVDDISLVTPAGGERLGALAPGMKFKLGWNRDGVAHTASITMPDRAPDPTSSATNIGAVGNTTVTVAGKGAAWTRDPLTGVLRITGDSITVIIRPPPRQ